MRFPSRDDPSTIAAPSVNDSQYDSIDNAGSDDPCLAVVPAYVWSLKRWAFENANTHWKSMLRRAMFFSFFSASHSKAIAPTCGSFPFGLEP
jgi:hypothetical protein